MWSALYWWVLTRFGIKAGPALLDTVCANGCLAAGSLVISNTIRFYLPGQNRYVYLTSLTGFITLVCFGLSSTLIWLWPGLSTEFSDFYSQSIPLRLAVSFLILGGITLLNVLWYTLQQQQENEQRKNEAGQLARDAELYKLRQQLQPHFLFNSLNSINALIVKEPQQARQMVQQLADFLRGTLRREDHQWVTLEEELAHLQLYLEIEKVRFGHRLNTAVEYEPDLASHAVPAMILQPVVENAIKYGLYDTTGDILISIQARLQGNELAITVTNPYDPTTTGLHAGTGFGLQSVRRRLYLLFGRQDLLKTHAADHQFTTLITIPPKL